MTDNRKNYICIFIAAILFLTLNNPLFSDDKYNWGMVTIPKGTEMKVELLRTVNSQMNVEGDPVPFKLLENVKIKKITVVKKGVKGKGILSKVQKKGMLGLSGRIDIKSGIVPAVDNTEIPVTINKKESQKNRTDAMILPAAGLFMGIPFFAAAGLNQGTAAIIPKGTELIIFTSEDADVFIPIKDIPHKIKNDTGIKLFIEKPLPSPFKEPEKWLLYIVKTKHRDKHLLLTKYKDCLKSEKGDMYSYSSDDKIMYNIDSDGNKKVLGEVIRTSEIQ